jgi:hypothetical protein
MMKKKQAVYSALLVAWIVTAFMAPVALAGEAGSESKPPALKAQTKCPIMGGAIDKKLYADVAGNRIYVCCKGCIAKIKEDPKKAIANLKAAGEKPELRLTLCKSCGELKGSPKCCAKDAAKCSKCGLNKGSPGCCKALKPVLGQQDIVLCSKCGEQKGTPECCAKDALKCSKCNLAKGSPGCCKNLDPLGLRPCAKDATCDASQKSKASCPSQAAACAKAKKAAGCCGQTSPTCPVSGSESK